MNEATEMDPVALLRAMETGCRNAAAGLPENIDPSEEWSGIAFRLGDQQLLVPVGEVIETLSLPQLTAIPNTADWVNGIANVRGRLLPVLDLRGLLYGEVAQSGPRSRVLVIDFDDVYFGLVVDEVHGLRHYPVEACVSAGKRMDDALGPYVSDGIQDEDVFRGIFSISALSASGRFMQAAV
ncbi:MAG: purine-binding chemotaxis protein CheW [Gammaproteobacteria bacterium]|nr:MAG: purine-binding chemotaxis protein CheW [Gammaproteobacteria bacterium]